MPINPYLQTSADAISRNLTQNLNENILPGINSGAIAAGGFGGSRQGIAQGLSIGRTQQAIGDAQTSLYGNAYESDANRAQQAAMQQAQLASNERLATMQDATNRYGLGNSYNLGLAQVGLGAGQLDLSNRVADQNFYSTQRGQDISQMGLGASLVNQGNLGLGSQGAQLYQNGYQQQQAPWQNLNNYGSLLGQFSGLNTTQTNTTPGTSALNGALGGALSLTQLLQLLSKGW